MNTLRSCRKQFGQTVQTCLVQRLGLKYGSGAVQHYSSFTSFPASEQRLAGQVAIITGGASGIGAQSARLFTAHGARVVIADIQDSLGEKLLKELGPQAMYVHCDVRKEEEVIAAWDKAFALENRLDVVFNNAGILGAVGPIDELHMGEYDATVAVNLRAAVLGVKHAARLMKPAKRGSIICTSSAASVLGGMGPLAYTISKGAVVALVKGAAGELRDDGIRVNAISPELVPTPLAAHAITALAEGGTQTMTVDMIDYFVRENTLLKGRALNDVDIANAALYLASDLAGYVSGHNLVVDAASTTCKMNSAGGNTWATKYRPMISENGRRGLAVEQQLNSGF